MIVYSLVEIEEKKNFAWKKIIEKNLLIKFEDENVGSDSRKKYF